MGEVSLVQHPHHSRTILLPTFVQRALYGRRNNHPLFLDASFRCSARCKCAYVDGYLQIANYERIVLFYFEEFTDAFKF